MARYRTPRLAIFLLIIALCLAGCSQRMDDYLAASSISKDGFARNAEKARELDGQVLKLWGFVDHTNIYGDDDARAILGDWWSGAGPDAVTWRFNFKTKIDDMAGESFAVTVPNDAGRDELLRQFVADARAQQPTRVFLTGKLVAFDAPTNNGVLSGLTLKLGSSGDVLLAPPDAK
jgi:hypothetical protein